MTESLLHKSMVSTSIIGIFLFLVSVTTMTLSGIRLDQARYVNSFHNESCTSSSYSIISKSPSFNKTTYVPAKCQVSVRMVCSSRSIDQDLGCNFEKCSDTEQLKACMERVNSNTTYQYWLNNKESMSDEEYKTYYYVYYNTWSLPVLACSILGIILSVGVPVALGLVHKNLYGYLYIGYKEVNGSQVGSKERIEV